LADLKKTFTAALSNKLATKPQPYLQLQHEQIKINGTEHQLYFVCNVKAKRQSHFEDV